MSFSTFAAQCKIYDLNEIKDTEIQQDYTFRPCERIRFRFDGEEYNLRLQTFEDGSATFSLRTGSGEPESFTLAEFDKKSFDLDHDNIVDFSIVADEIILSATRRRVMLTFQTDEDIIKHEDSGIQETPEPEQQQDQQQDEQQNREEELSSEPTPTEAVEEQEVLVSYNEKIQEKKPTPAPTEDVMSGTTFNIITGFLIALFIILIAIVAGYLLKKKGSEFFHHEKDDFIKHDQLSKEIRELRRSLAQGDHPFYNTSLGKTEEEAEKQQSSLEPTQLRHAPVIKKERSESFFVSADKPKKSTKPEIKSKPKPATKPKAKSAKKGTSTKKLAKDSTAVKRSGSKKAKKR